jgi:hypothetical protein
VIATQQGGTLADTAAVTVTAPVPVATVSVSPASASVMAGGTQQLTATLRDAGGNTLSGRSIGWSSSNASVATVNTSGLMSAITPGAATITATSEGQQGTSALTVTTPPPPGTAWPNRPGALTRVLANRAFGSNAASDDPAAGAWTVYEQSGVFESNSSTEPVSPPSAFHSRLPASDNGGAGDNLVATIALGREWYVGYTTRVPVGFMGHSSGKIKQVWVGSYPDSYLLSLDGSGAGGLYFRVTIETMANGSNANFGNAPLPNDGQWHTVEYHVTQPASNGGTGRIRLWLDGVLRSDVSVPDMRNSEPAYVQWNPYVGGVGGSMQGGPVDMWVGHIFVATTP